MIGGPDVIKELYFDDWLDATRRETHRATDDVGFSKGGIVDTVTAELALQTPRHLEDTAFSLQVVDMLVAGDIGHVLSEDDHPRIANHFVPHALVQQIHHRGGGPTELRVFLSVELLARGIHTLRIDM